MAILTPSAEATTSTWATSKHYFNKFTTGTSMSLVHNSVIDNLIENAVEKPSTNVDADAGETGIVVVDNNGAARWAIAGNDFMSPNSTTVLSNAQVIYLSNSGATPTGYISGNGDGKFITLSATTIDTGTLNATTLVNSPTVSAATFSGGAGKFTTVGATTHVSTPLVSTTTVNAQTINGVAEPNGALNINTVLDSETGTWLGTVTVNGALSVANNITAASMDVANLTLNRRPLAGAAVALIYFGESAPSGNADLGYNLWVNTTTNAQTLNYRVDTSTSDWVPLGAVFK